MGRIIKVERNDAMRLLPAARLFAHEANLPGRFNADNFISTIVSLFDSGILFCYGIDGEDGVDGGIGGITHQDLTSGDKVAMELFWFMKPEVRGSRDAIRLFDAYEQEAKARGCRRVMMATICGLGDERISELYKRRGYTEFERHFIKDL